jgi:DNA-binding transcriptional LysR family regulator
MSTNAPTAVFNDTVDDCMTPVHSLHAHMNVVHYDEGMDLRSVDLNLLVTLEAIINERSVSRAAVRLGLTQSAVSHALRRLRTLFQDELVVRGPTGMAPTPRALEIAAVLSGSLEDIGRVLDRHTNFDPRTSTRSFTLHLSDYVAPFLLPVLCARLRSEAPSVRLQVTPFRGTEVQILPNEVHIRVTTHDEIATPGIHDERLLEDEYVVLMSRDHPQARSRLTLPKYLQLSHVKVSAAALGTNLIDDALARRGVERQIAVLVPSWFNMRDLVAHTDLVVAMPRRWAADPAISAGCTWQPLPLEEVTFAVGMRWRSRDNYEPGHVWLRDLIVEVFSASKAAAMPRGG